MDFIPEKVSYRRLLERFWQLHDPSHPSLSRQYASAVFYRGDSQHDQIAETLKAVHGKSLADVQTIVEPLDEFHRAENYHQKYRLRQSNPFMSLFDEIYSPAEFADSTVAARVNGFLSGYGTRELLEEEWQDYGLPEAWREPLRNRIRG